MAPSFFQATLWQLLGLRMHGLLPAVVIPVFLTMVLFLGPLSMQGFSGLWKLYAGMSARSEHLSKLDWVKDR
jgi:prenyl protein peptidase